ncbi:type II toxin-antitoxin system HicA family toxin [Candidatus Parcubacteria bacterium]|nr:type II toxin-antitoxin system HicA family toxin [Candidatus Parcubacteria bacterium]
MPKLKTLTAKKIIKLLEKKGFQLDRKSGSHFIFYHPQNKKRVIVAFHNKDLPKGTLISILKQAGIDYNELR